jgi:hypothetical protein
MSSDYRERIAGTDFAVSVDKAIGQRDQKLAEG